jgi:hypothetical protein
MEMPPPCERVVGPLETGDGDRTEPEDAAACVAAFEPPGEFTVLTEVVTDPLTDALEFPAPEALVPVATDCGS